MEAAALPATFPSTYNPKNLVHLSPDKEAQAHFCLRV